MNFGGIQLLLSLSVCDALINTKYSYLIIEKTGSVYEEAVKHLTSMATKEGYLYFYLSMMYALMGKGEESSNMYRKFLVS